MKKEVNNQWRSPNQRRRRKRGRIKSKKKGIFIFFGFFLPKKKTGRNYKKSTFGNGLYIGYGFPPSSSTSFLQFKLTINSNNNTQNNYNTPPTKTI